MLNGAVCYPEMPFVVSIGAEEKTLFEKLVPLTKVNGERRIDIFGKIDLTLQPSGRQHTLDFAEVLLRYLYENDGYCNLGDKSPAELIYDRFQVSKKARSSFPNVT